MYRTFSREPASGKIGHMLFAFISKNWRGRPLETLEIIVNLMGSATASTGLKVKCKPDMNAYEKANAVTYRELKEMNFTDKRHGE